MGEVCWSLACWRWAMSPRLLITWWNDKMRGLRTEPRCRRLLLSPSSHKKYSELSCLSPGFPGFSWRTVPSGSSTSTFSEEETELPLEVPILGTQDRSTGRRQCPYNPGQQFVLRFKWEETHGMMHHLQWTVWALFKRLMSSKAEQWLDNNSSCC